MGLPDRGVDALQVFLTGGASNANPDASLGGAASSTRVRGLAALVTKPIPALRIDNVFPAAGVGAGSLAIDTTGALVFTPPGGGAGAPVAIAAGESRIVPGSSPQKAVRVFRDGTYPWGTVPGSVCDVTLVEILNGALAQKNLTSAERVAGKTTYRALMLKGAGFGVSTIKLWLPPVAGSQAAFSLALETPVAGSLQAIANETTAPSGLSWSTPTDEASSLVVPSLGAGRSVGLWIKRVFPPAGHVASLEKVRLVTKFLGA